MVDHLYQFQCLQNLEDYIMNLQLPANKGQSTINIQSGGNEFVGGT